MPRMIFATMLIGLFVAGVIPAADAATYTAHLLGVSPGYDGSEGTSINDNGTALCSAATASDVTGVFTWSRNSGLVDLSGQGILAYAGINSDGQTVGMYKDQNSGWFRPYIHDADGTKMNLQIPFGVADVWPGEINKYGQVAVILNYRDTDGNVYKSEAAIIDTNGSLTQVDLPNAGAEVSAMSNTGYVAVNAAGRAYIWNEAGRLNPLTGLNDTDATRLWDVNDWGSSVGSSGDHAVIWNADGSITDLGIGFAYGINNLGQVVGQFNSRAVLRNPDGSIVDLGLGESSWATAINDNGWVVGGVYCPDPETPMMAVLWEPVPEPSALAALAAGIVSLGGMVLRKRK